MRMNSHNSWIANDFRSDTREPDSMEVDYIAQDSKGQRAKGNRAKEQGARGTRIVPRVRKENSLRARLLVTKSR